MCQELKVENEKKEKRNGNYACVCMYVTVCTYVCLVNVTDLYVDFVRV